MCKYCENANKANDITFGLWHWNGKWHITTDGIDEEIFFCPKCGQELSKISENDKATTE